MAVHNHRKRELKVQSKAKSEGVSQYYSIGAVITVGVIGGLGYYIYRTKKRGPKSLGTHSAEGPTSGKVNVVPNHHQPPNKPSPQTNKFEMD